MTTRKLLFLLAWLSAAAATSAFGAEKPLGKRPYEMDWAKRTKDTRPPLVDFEDLKGWTVECDGAEAAWTCSREQQLWGKYVGKLTYRGTGKNPKITLRPPKPVPVSLPLDCVNLWLHGNNVYYDSKTKDTPPVTVKILLRGGGGKSVPVTMATVRWKEWWVMHRRLTAEQIAMLEDGVFFAGIEITGGRNKEDRFLYFDNLHVYQEPLAPLKFDPRPKRGIDLPKGQTTGTNTGPGKLPFPTREETILPDNLAEDFKASVEKSGDTYEFHYRGADGHLVYRYRPATCTLGDVTAEWAGRGGPFQPMAGGGVYFVDEDKPVLVAPDGVKLIDCRQVDDTVVSTWQCTWGKQTAQVTYTLRLWQKSLVVDVKCPGGRVGEFRVGAAVGLTNPRLVTLPYLTGDHKRPAVLVTGPPREPLFVMALVDHCRSNASSLWMANKITEKGVFHNGGSRYLPKTDGRRNDCFERLFLTVSPRFEEVLPNIPNPKSPWMHVTGERLWRAHGAGNRERDYAFWKKIARYGMTKTVITDHETGWRDGNESFTFRTRAAPGKGGDEGQAEYSRKIRALGFRYGIYNNYTDYAPVNEHWNEDWVTRVSDGNWRTAWNRCYNPKPARAVEAEARLTPIIQQKFHLDTAYCDVHTAVRPWQYCDFDARVPGAGTFAGSFYAYGEIMLHQKKTWNGPVYSEGNNHWYYCGLTDGNYGQDQLAHLDREPWLVDFDLRKMHPLCSSFGMGNLGMFHGRGKGLGDTPAERTARLDRFLAATLAFGHTGFLVTQGGTTNTVRSYFNLQQVHARYARDVVSDIRYADDQGKLLDTSDAVATETFRRSQIATTYSNGMKVVVNGHPTETWKTPEAVLPPNGWWAKDKEGTLIAFSALVDGHRVDYVDSPAYIYADGRGRFTRFAKAACDGQLIAHRRPDGSLEVIPVGKVTSFGVSLDGRAATATAHDEEAKEIGPAKTRLARGLVYVTPVPKAFSYLIKPSTAPMASLKCERDEVVPGETVKISGKTDQTYRIPADAVPGARLWQQFGGAWIDFTVVPMVDVELTVDEAEEAYRLALTSRLPEPVDAGVTLAGRSQAVRLVPKQAVAVRFPFQRPTEEEVRAVAMKVMAGEFIHRRTWWLKAEESIVAVVGLPEEFEPGQCFRKKKEEKLDTATGAQVSRRATTCGNVTRPSLFMHPPYKTGVGYSFAVFGPVDLPKQPAAAFRCDIGKTDGGDTGDGILFRVLVVTPDGKETLVAERQWIERVWTPLEADLSPWAGNRVRIKLVADVGPKDNSSADWAAWSNMRIESAAAVLVSTLHHKPVRLRHEPGPHPQKDLTVTDLRKARKATLHFQGVGLQSGGQYVCNGQLNGLPVGAMPSAGGNEKEGVWSDASMPLEANAIAGLAAENRFNIHNPGEDCFKIRHFWIELELADGRRCSSLIATTTYTQPIGWLYAEGTEVPFGEDIEVRIRFKAGKP